MPLPDDIRGLADRILGRLDEVHDFYLHTSQAWRVVQEVAREGRTVGMIDRTSGQEVSAPDLEPLAQRYVATHHTESVFKELSGLLEEGILGLARVWLTAYPVQLGDIIQIDEPHLLDCLALLRGVVETMADASIRRSSGPRAPSA